MILILRPQEVIIMNQSIFGSFDPKYYGELITKVNLHAREEYRRAAHYSHKQKYKRNNDCIVKKEEENTSS
jgi:hypothetical protein